MARAVPSDPVLRPFLPLVYVAWADGDLAPEEIRAICSRVDSLDQARGGTCEHMLGPWLDPDSPPDAQDLSTLLAAIRTFAGTISKPERQSLVDFGAELAKAADHEITPPERQALEEIEGALGVSGTKAALGLLVGERPAAEAVEAEAAFDVGAMTRLLDGEQREIRQQVRQLLSGPDFGYRYGLSTAEYREQVLSWLKQLAAQGLGALSFPTAAGGRGSMADFIAAFETMAYGDLSLLIKTGVQFGLFGGSILQLGTDRHHLKYLPSVANLELPGCFAMTETGHGSNVQDLETVAGYDRETQEFVVHTPHESAGKDYIGNAACHGRMATVFAQLEVAGEKHGVHALLVPIRNTDGNPRDGVRIEDCGEKLGLNGVDNGRLWFDQVRVPRDNLLDRFASVSAEGEYQSPIASPERRFFTMLGTLVGGRVSVALGGLSASKSALAIAVRYGARRRQFGATGEPETVLLDYRTHQRRLMPRLATTYALDFALKYLARRYTESTAEDRRDVETLAAGLKAYSTWHATDTIQACRQACGGKGYLAENRFAALKADTEVFTTFEGDNTVLLQLAAKSLLTGLRRQFSEMGVLGLARYVAEHAAIVVTELNPVATRRTDEEHLLDRELHLSAFQWRKDHLLSTLARRLKKRLDAGMDGFHALNEVQDHAVSLAKAYTEQVVLEQFSAGVEACEDPTLAHMLTKVCDLYALHRIEADRGWFLEHGYLEAGKAKAIRKQVNRLCGELRQQAVPLVDAFGIPPQMLAAPIAL